MLPAPFLKPVAERWMLFFFTGSLSDTLLAGELGSPQYELLLAWVCAWAPWLLTWVLPWSLQVSLLNFMLLVVLSVLLLKQLEGIGANSLLFPEQGSDMSKLPCFRCSVKAAVFSCLLADRMQLVSESLCTCCQVSVYTCAITVDLLAHGNYHVCLHPVMAKITIYKSRLKSQCFWGGRVDMGGIEQLSCVSRPVR